MAKTEKITSQFKHASLESSFVSVRACSLGGPFFREYYNSLIDTLHSNFAASLSTNRFIVSGAKLVQT